MMPVLPGGFDKHAPQMRVPGFGDPAADLFGATRVFRRDKAGEGHHARGWEPPGVTEFSGDGEAGEIIDASEAALALDPRAQRLDREEVAELRVDGPEAADRFIDGADRGAVRLLERGQRPALRLWPGLVPLGPRAFGGREAATVAQQKLWTSDGAHAAV